MEYGCVGWMCFYSLDEYHNIQDQVRILLTSVVSIEIQMNWAFLMLYIVYLLQILE